VAGQVLHEAGELEGGAAALVLGGSLEEALVYLVLGEGDAVEGEIRIVAVTLDLEVNGVGNTINVL
jgi:hypothetical protein